MINIISNFPQSPEIFTFSTFVTALSLLVIVFTLIDVRYQFRTAISPFPLYRGTFFIILLIGIGTLFTDVWFAENWRVPNWLNNQAIWQGAFGGLFLAMAAIWISVAFIRPPKFGKYNSAKYVTTLLKIIVKGSNDELAIVGDELGKSVHDIIKNTKTNAQKLIDQESPKSNKTLGAGEYAYDLLLLIANRKFCRMLINSAPGTVIELFREVNKTSKFDIPISQFSKNISTEAIANTDSILYHEDNGYNTGLIGYIKLFTQAVYGNYTLVESLKNGSPLDIDYELRSGWNAEQLEKYTMCVSTVIESYLLSANWPHHSSTIARALKYITDSVRDLYKINKLPEESNDTISNKLLPITWFFRRTIDLLEESKRYVPKKSTEKFNFYDQLADAMFNVIVCASMVSSPQARCWSIQYVCVWDPFFVNYNTSNAWKIIRYKLSRKIFEEIRRLENMPNFKSARVLGFCLNVMGFHLPKKAQQHLHSEPALHRAILKWTKSNFLKLRAGYKQVSESILLGSLSYDEANMRIVKTYHPGVRDEAPKDFLSLS